MKKLLTVTLAAVFVLGLMGGVVVAGNDECVSYLNGANWTA